MTHQLDDARAQMREGHTSAQWELIAREKVMRTLLETGEFTADVLAELSIPVEYRKHVHGAATGYFSGAEPFMDEAGRRKSERPSRKGGKNTLFVISAKGRRELPKLLRDLQRELRTLTGSGGDVLSSGGASLVAAAPNQNQIVENAGLSAAAQPDPSLGGPAGCGRSTEPGELTPASDKSPVSTDQGAPASRPPVSDAGSPESLVQLDGARKAPSMFDPYEGQVA
jgi:hypothetical protein